MMRRLAAAAASAALIAGLGALDPAVASAAETGPVTIAGKVGCLNSYSPDGIWVIADNGGSGFATMSFDLNDGFAYTHYTYVLPAGGSYSLNVGCGGSPQNWGMTAHTPTVAGTENSFKCNDVNPLLEAAGDWAFGRILGRWIKALDLTQGIDYGTCARI